MSAFICDQDHIKLLAIFAASRGRHGIRVEPRYVEGMRGTPAENVGGDQLAIANLFADVLYAENVRSVQGRYEGCARDNLPGPNNDAGHVTVTQRDMRASMYDQPALVILKACDCLEYQSCENDDYRESTAWHLLGAIRKAAIHAIPGYDDALGWEFTAEGFKRWQDEVRAKVRASMNHSAH